MPSKLSERFFQVALGILLVALSSVYLWRGTLLPILKGRFSLDAVSDSVRLGIRYFSWEDRAEAARAKALEADRQRRGGGVLEGAGQAPAQKDGDGKTR